MSNLFRATLVRDVSYLDFSGIRHTQYAGTEVWIEQNNTPGVWSLDTDGNAIEETLGSYIARVGEISFDIHKLQFQIIL